MTLSEDILAKKKRTHDSGHTGPLQDGIPNWKFALQSVGRSRCWAGLFGGFSGSCEDASFREPPVNAAELQLVSHAGTKMLCPMKCWLQSTCCWAPGFAVASTREVLGPSKWCRPHCHANRHLVKSHTTQTKTK